MQDLRVVKVATFEQNNDPERSGGRYPLRRHCGDNWGERTTGYAGSEIRGSHD